jgi:type III secretion protein L
MSFLIERPMDDAERTLRVRAVGKVLRGSQYAVLTDAQGVLEHARATAARIIADAEAAYRTEQERGYAEGVAAAKVEQATAMVRLSERTAAYLKDLEQEIADLVIASLRRIVADFDDRQRVLTVVRSGLVLVRRQKHVLLHIHPDDAVFVRENMGALLSSFPGVSEIDVVPNEGYLRGACRLETPIGTVETSLDDQLTILQQALLPAAPDGTTSQSNGGADHV